MSEFTFDQFKHECEERSKISNQNEFKNEDETAIIQKLQQKIIEEEKKAEKGDMRRRSSEDDAVLRKKMKDRDKKSKFYKGEFFSQDSWNCDCQNSPILIVDDNIFNLESLKLIVKDKFGILPDMAQNGKEAFEMFKKKNLPNSSNCSIENCFKSYYHLIFMDLNMPIMDGFESTRLILEW